MSFLNKCIWDRVIIRLGPPGGGRVIGFDIDTANFNGNEAPATRVEGTISEGDPAPDDFFVWISYKCIILFDHTSI